MTCEGLSFASCSCLVVVPYLYNSADKLSMHAAKISKVKHTFSDTVISNFIGLDEKWLQSVTILQLSLHGLDSYGILN